jgi:hypothetical protein
VKRLLAAAAALTLGAAALAAPAAGASGVSNGATAYSAGAATGAANLSATLTLTGAVGGLLDGMISPIVSSALNPLVQALQGTVNGVVAGVLGAGSPNAAGTPTQQAAAVAGTFPNETFPGGAACTSGSATQPCYATLSAPVHAAPLADITAGVVHGFTQQTRASDDPTNPIYGRAQVTSVAVSVLSGISALTSPLAGVAAVDAKANCPGDGAADPSVSVSATDVTLLGGLVRLDVLNGAVADLTINGASVGTLANLAPIALPGGVTVRSYGTSVRVDVTLSLDQLLTGLGLAGLAVSQLLADVTSSSLTLSILAGPNSTVTANSAKAWGLGLGVDLSGSLEFDLLGLAGARVALPTGIGAGNFGNVLDLRLAYASCSAGTAPPSSHPPAVPPANV